MRKEILIAMMHGIVLIKKESLPMPDYSPPKQKIIINKLANGAEITLTEENKSCFDKKYMFIVDRKSNIYQGCWEMIGNRINIYYETGEQISYAYDKKQWIVKERP